MKSKEIQKQIDRVVGTEGTLRIPSWWMHKILSDLVKSCKDNEGASVPIKEYVESQLSLVGKTIEALDTRLENIESHELFEIVSELPSEPKDNTIYLIPSQNGEGNNVLTEWVYINGTWEQFGEFKADIDLRKLSEKVDKLEEQVPSVFEAVYGQTTFNEILEAYNDGKYIVCSYNNNVFHINRISVDEIYFISVNGHTVYRLAVGTANNWYQSVYSPEMNTNKTKSLSSASTDTQYPSAKAVYDALQNVGGGKKEWKCVMERRMEAGERETILTTFQDNTPLRATEIIVQVLMDVSAERSSQGYIQVQSTNNKNTPYYGAVHFEGVLSDNTPCLSQIKLVASPHTYLVAEILDKSNIGIAQGNDFWGRVGKDLPQIYEDFTWIKIGPSNPYTSAAPYIKIYAR